MHSTITILTVLAGLWNGAIASVLFPCPAIFCFAYACDVETCPAQVGAKCIAGCGGCTATFEDKFGNDLTKKCRCGAGIKPTKCIPDPCETAVCGVTDKAECRTDTCGGACKPIFYDENAVVIQQCSAGIPQPEPTPLAAICPPLPPGTVGICIDACGAVCSPPQLCCSNGCGRVCKDPYFPGKENCPMLPYVFKDLCVDECSTTSDCVFGKKCCSTKCGKECRTPFPESCDKMNCATNQCSVETCATHTQAKCKAVCGTCVALFADKFNNYIGEKCKCPGKIYVANCEDDLCGDKECPADPTAECRINSCGGCNIEFFDKHGKKVDCDKSDGGGIFSNLFQYYMWYKLLYGSMGDHDQRCPSYPPPGSTACVVQCSTDHDCARGYACCTYGCKRICISTGSLYSELDPSCPPVTSGGSTLFCSKECSSNSDCGYGSICCSNGCGTQCSQRLPVTDDRCPRSSDLQRHSPPNRICPTVLPQCYSNSDCRPGEICCSTSDGCTTQCRSNSNKRCPPPDPDILAKLPFMTCLAGTCTDNSQCHSGQICCSDGCSSKCIDIPGPPSGSYDPRCPLSIAPVSQISCVHHCSSNSDCRSNYMCCGSYCGSQCVLKPHQPCDPGELPAPCYNACKGLPSPPCPIYPTAQCWVYSCNGCKRELYDENNRIIKDCFGL